MRRKIIAGNWKMNKTPSEAVGLIRELKPMVINADADVVFCVPSVSLMLASDLTKDSNVKIGAQNIYFEESGAYTGEISAKMLADIGVKYVILGHSERRKYFSETNDIVNKKIIKALEYKLIPIVCCGETLEQRESGVTLEHIEEQIRTAFENVNKEDMKQCIIAYEPIWAIGTGRVATSKQAEEVCGYIRACIAKTYDEETAEAVRILYGGSVKPANAKEIFAEPNIDGGLVGGSSIKTEFAEIVNYNK